MPSLEHIAPQLSVYEESNAPDSWCMDYESAPSTTPTSPHLGPSKPQASSPDANVNIWEEDTDLFPEYSWLWPSEQNGTWLTSAIQRPSSAISSINGTHIRNAISEVGDAVSDRITHALDGKDLPAMHDKAVSYLTPSVSMPSLRQVSQGVGKVTDRAQEAFARGRRQVRQQGRSFSAAPAKSASSSSSPTVEEGEEGKDQFTFASTMSSRAVEALTTQGISNSPINATHQWQKRLESALILLFIFATSEDGGEYDAETLFATTPVWVADAEGKVWRLKLDTGLVDIIAVVGDECKEKPIWLDVDFEVDV